MEILTDYLHTLIVAFNEDGDADIIIPFQEAASEFYLFSYEDENEEPATWGLLVRASEYLK